MAVTEHYLVFFAAWITLVVVAKMLSLAQTVCRVSGCIHRRVAGNPTPSHRGFRSLPPDRVRTSYRILP